jgi:3D (Asp-Asp-Asp) domain-containing protein
MVSLLFSLLLLNPIIAEVKTTGYCNHAPCVDEKWADGRTASNTIAREGVCAANWKIFPRGSILYIPGYGECRVEDTGNPLFVNGLHLDLFFDDIKDAREWGIKQKSVTVIFWPK